MLNTKHKFLTLMRRGSFSPTSPNQNPSLKKTDIQHTHSSCERVTGYVPVLRTVEVSKLTIIEKYTTEIYKGQIMFLDMNLKMGFHLFSVRTVRDSR